MEEITIILDKSELEGTCYIEIVTGKYQGKHWQEGSLFFEEEIFGLIEPIFKKYVSGYDHYDMNDASKLEWSNIISRLKELNELLESSNRFEDALGNVGFIFVGTRDYFQTHYNSCKSELVAMNKQLINWASEVLSNNEHIAILGI